MADDVGHGRVEVIAALLAGARGQARVELLGLELGDFGVLGRAFAQQTLPVQLGDQGAGFLALSVDGCAGGAAFGQQHFAGLAALTLNIAVGDAAAIVDAGLQLKGIAHALDFGGMRGIELENGIVFLLDLAVKARGQDRGLSTALALAQRGTQAFNAGIDAAEPRPAAAISARASQTLVCVSYTASK